MTAVITRFIPTHVGNARFLETFKPSLYIPGCPTHPLVFIAGVMDLLGIEG